MPLTIDEIESHEERLRAEMANIQRLLDAYAVFRSQAAERSRSGDPISICDSAHSA